MTDYIDVCEYLSSKFDRVNGYNFYRDIFPNNEITGELNTNYSKPNAIYLYQDENKKMKRRIMLNDTWEEDYMSYVECNPMTLCSGLTYRGRTNKLEHAQQMNALIFDIDDVGLNELENILHLTTLPATHIRSILMPTYIVASGTGVHLYYVFKEPIDLYPNIKVQLKSLKYDLTFRFWNPTVTSKEKQIQYQSINQSFRMVGSINNKYNTEVVAFKTGNRYTISDLNAYCDNAENHVDVNKPFRPSRINKEEAKEKYPEWYQRVVVEGDKHLKKWDIKGKVHGDNPFALYDWWRRQIENIKGGHRYFYLMCMSIYACKCDVPLKKLKKDMKEDIVVLQNIKHKNKLTEEDLKSALEMYSREYYNFTIDDIEKLTDVQIERNKRNYQKQSDHLEEARAIRDIRQKRNGTKWDDNNGRKPKKDIVEEWRKNNPNGTKYQCTKETGLSKNTVKKWWDGGSDVAAKPIPPKKPKMTDEQLIQMFISDIVQGLSAEEITDKVVNAVDSQSSDEERQRVHDLIESTQKSMENIVKFNQKMM